MHFENENNIFDTQLSAGFSPKNNYKSNQFNVEIMSLTFQETSTYDDMYHRDLRGTLSEESGDTLSEIVLRNGGAVRGTAFADFASDFIDLDGGRGEIVEIPNGWETPRFRFLMQVRETSINFPDEVFYTYVQGFTDKAEFSKSLNSLEPSTTLFVNGFFQIKEVVVPDRSGGTRLIHRVYRQGQMINGMLIRGRDEDDSVYYTRPTDVYAKVQSEEMGYKLSKNVVDGRIENRNGNLSVLSSFKNDSPTNYLSRLIAPTVDAYNNKNQGGGYSSTIDIAWGNSCAQEPQVHATPLLRLLESQFNVPGGAYFTIRELEDMDRYIGDVTEVFTLDEKYRSRMFGRGQLMNWDNAEPETLLATKIRMSVPGLMWECFLGKMSFSITNRTPNGRVMISYDRDPEPISIYTPKEIIHHFETELIDVIARDVSYNNKLDFEVSVSCSVLSEIIIHVSISGGLTYSYMAPTFTSGLSSSMYTRNLKNLDQFSSTLKKVVYNLEDESRSSSVGRVTSLGGFSEV